MYIFTCAGEEERLFGAGRLYGGRERGELDLNCGDARRCGCHIFEFLVVSLTVLDIYIYIVMICIFIVVVFVGVDG